MKKLIYIFLVIVLLFLLTIFPYLILVSFFPSLDSYKILLFIYIIISGIFLGKYWWKYVYILNKHPRKGRPFFLPKKTKKKNKK
ncbi:hypothetical protein HUU51_05490 [Candidatus Gracilibacteria bacterium]|nr:hypothetical protein [Candidatus Gracilibacteria bacterium]